MLRRPGRFGGIARWRATGAFSRTGTTTRPGDATPGSARASTRLSHPLRTLGEVSNSSDRHHRVTVDGEGLLAGLTPAQERAVTVDAAPLCVLAGAGAGKTRVLTRRIAHRVAIGDADPAHILVITFTRKAADEIVQRLAALGLRDRIVAGTFHSVASAQLRRWWADRGIVAPTLLAHKGRLLGPLLSERTDLAGMGLSEAAAHLEWARARRVTPQDFVEVAGATHRPLSAPASAVATLYGRYDDEKRRRGLIDFDDLLGRCADAFDTDPTFAAAQRWRWRHLFVDEFQDVNPLQHRLLTSWMGAGTDLCVVGDPHQAIYSWNGADPALLGQVATRWPSTTVVRLDDNHRCSPQIVAAAAAVVGDAAPVRSTRPPASPVTVRSYPDDAAEAAGVAAAVVGAHGEGLAWSQMAVLVRTNAQAAALAGTLDAAGIPQHTPGQAALLDDPAVAAPVGRWRQDPRLPTQMAVADLTAEAAIAADAGDDAAAAAIRALGDTARTFERLQGPSTVGALLAWVGPAGGDRPGPGNAVTVSSFHRAKGLEWAAVWVCGLEAGLVPISRADTPAAVAEERRLLYVALTRAGSRLACSWAATRRFGGRAVPRVPSPWVEALTGAGAVDLDPSSAPLPTVVDPETWHRRLDEQRAALVARRNEPDSAGAPPRRRRVRGRSGEMVALPAPDEDLVRSLVAWRSAVARSSGVPAHVVLHDRTLDALASLRPTTLGALLDVPGVGPVTAQRLGPTLLPLMSDRRASA